MGMIVLNKESISQDELVELNKIQSNPKGCDYHTIEDHIFYMEKYHRCLYCMLGSIPEEKKVIVERL